MIAPVLPFPPEFFCFEMIMAEMSRSLHFFQVDQNFYKPDVKIVSSLLVLKLDAALLALSYHLLHHDE